MNNSSYRYGDSAPYQAKYDNILRNYKIVDIGTILSIGENNDTVTVQGYGVDSNGVEVFKEVEILYCSGENTITVGQPCLLIRPATDIVNVRKGLLNKANNIHNILSLKAIPMYFGDSKVIVGRKNGNYVIHTDAYEIMFGEGEINLTYKDLGTVSMDAQGLLTSLPYISSQIGDELNILFTDSNDIPTLYMHYDNSGNIIYKQGAKEKPQAADYDNMAQFTKWSWTKQINSDGSVTVNQYDASQNIINTLTISATGTVTISTGKDTPVSISIGQNGVFSIDNTKGSVTIDASGNINITGDGKVTLGNGNTLLKIFDDLYNALSSLQTKGSPAAQAADPTWVQTALKPWQTVYQGVLA